jgi:hypothetical protein
LAWSASANHPARSVRLVAQVQDLVVPQMHDHVAGPIALAAQHPDRAVGERPAEQLHRPDGDSLQGSLFVRPCGAAECRHRLEQRYDLAGHQGRLRRHRDHAGNPAEGARPVGLRVAHLRKVLGGHEVLDRGAPLRGQFVDQVVVADVVDVPVRGEQHQLFPWADHVDGAPQGVPETGRHTGVDQEHGVLDPMHQGIGHVRLVFGDVEDLSGDQHGAVVDPGDVADRHGRRPPWFARPMDSWNRSIQSKSGWSDPTKEGPQSETEIGSAAVWHHDLQPQDPAGHHQQHVVAGGGDPLIGHAQ